MRRPITGSPWLSPCSAQDDGAPSTIPAQGLVQALDDIATLAQLSQTLLRILCQHPACRPGGFGQAQPLERAHPPDPEILQGSPAAATFRPKINDPICRPRFPGQHAIEPCPAFGRHFHFEASARLEF